MVKYGDVPALLALGSSQRLFIRDSEPAPALVEAAFPGDRLTWTTTDTDVASTLVAWLMEKSR
jgi:hypothetical protein